MTYVMLFLGLLLVAVIGYLLGTQRAAERPSDGPLEHELLQQLTAKEAELGALRSNLFASERLASQAQAEAAARIGRAGPKCDVFQNHMALVECN